VLQACDDFTVDHALFLTARCGGVLPERLEALQNFLKGVDNMGVQKPNTIDEIRQHLESNLGKRVSIRANQGRRRYLESKGVLVETYPKLFVVHLDQSNAVRRRSYTYADVLTDTVQITIDSESTSSC
jgi:uncharacterized protein Veg